MRANGYVLQTKTTDVCSGICTLRPASECCSDLCVDVNALSRECSAALFICERQETVV